MQRGEDFEVPKEVFDRAQEFRGYMADEDIPKYFSQSIQCGYGLYDCVVRKCDGKYICSYWTGDTCD